MADGDRTVHRGGAIQLAALAGVPSCTVILHRFEDVMVVGPAVVVPQGTRFEGCKWGGAFREVWTELPPGTQIKGAIYARDCEFIRCAFVAVGFLADPDAMALAGERITD